MAPVSDVEVSERGGRRGGGFLSLEDCSCPVCLEIFMEPVTLPCTHTFCKGCFLESVDKATLCCPLCRKRVSTWARLNSRNNTLVNQDLWTRIQSSFPLQCQRRLSGQDSVSDDDPTVSVCFPRVSRPGELRQEYEAQVSRLTEEKRVLEEEQRRASEEYIQKLLQEEEELLKEDQQRQENDERLARLLSNQLNSSVSHDKVSPSDMTPAKKKKEFCGQIDRFLCPRPPQHGSSASSSSANKENILSQEELLPQLDYYGPRTPHLRPDAPDLFPDAPDLLPGDPHLYPKLLSSASVEEVPESNLTRDGPSSAKRKWSEVMKHEEEQLSRRQQQEEEDRRVALLLQKELDQEEKMKATDRRKGSSDAYLLRQNRRERVEASRSSRKTSSSSSSSSCSSCSSSSTPAGKTSTGRKQSTLTEMFSSLKS